MDGLDEHRGKRKTPASLAMLQHLNRDELLAMPAASTEEVEFVDETVLFTAYIERHLDGRLLILVRSDQQSFIKIFRDSEDKDMEILFMPLFCPGSRSG